MQIYGINFSIGIIAICIPYIAINAKVFSEQIENINPKTIESIKQINGVKLSSLITLVWSPVIETFKNFGLYRLECAIRSTAVFGLFGIGGIGTSIFLSFQTLNFRELWTYLWGLAFLIISSKELFKKINLSNIPKKLLISFLISLFSLDLVSLSETDPKSAPTSTTDPFFEFIFVRTPDTGEGTSKFTLSVSSSTSGSSTSTESPSFFNHLETVASVILSPRTGTNIFSLINIYSKTFFIISCC